MGTVPRLAPPCHCLDMNHLLKTSIAILPAVALTFAAPGLAQTSFGDTTMVEAEAASARDVFAADLNGDGIVDLLTASRADDTIAWYENLGGGVFSPRNVINANADGAQWVEAADFDNDGDLDVVSASALDDTVAWYENLGGGQFGPAVVLTDTADTLAPSTRWILTVTPTWISSPRAPWTTPSPGSRTSEVGASDPGYRSPPTARAPSRSTPRI